MYEGLEEIDAIDANYLDNFAKLKGETYDEKLSYLGEFTFNNCCTFLTAILRGERFVQGLFDEAVANGDVLKLLERAYEVL